MLIFISSKMDLGPQTVMFKKMLSSAQIKIPQLVINKVLLHPSHGFKAPEGYCLLIFSDLLIWSYFQAFCVSNLRIYSF